MALFHIHMTGVLKGQTQFVTLNVTLGQTEVSRDAWDEAVLKSNPEVVGYLSKKYIELVDEKQYAALEAKATQEREDALDPSSTTLDDALAIDNPSVGELRRHVKAAQDALARIEAAISGKPLPPKAAPPVKAQEKPPEDDGLDLPQSPPKGLKPQVMTEQYLKKGPAEKRKFLKDCRDIGLLRDAALFEPDPKMKIMARKAARMAEKTAQEAAGLSAASLEN